MNLNQRLIYGLLLLVALVTTVALLTVSALRGGAAHNGTAHTATLVAWIAIPAAILIAVGAAMAVLGPLRRSAQQVRAIGQGNLEQRLEWSADDSLGQMANDVNRMVVHVRDLRETEFGRKQMEHQLSDAVVQSIFEPVIVTDARGQVLKLNTAAEQLLGESAGDRMALANTPGGQKILQAVRDAVWNPLAAALAGKRVFVLPSGALHRMAWGALPEGDRYLADAGYVVHTLNHERELLARPAGADVRSDRLLAIADPSTGAAPAGLTRACARAWPASTLPGARREAERIGALWQAHFGAGGPATILEGAAATEPEVRAVAPGAGVLHFATHGLELAGDCASEGDTLAKRSFAIAVDAPLDDKASAATAAALVLAPGPSSADDGLLTAQEIAMLDLSNTRWAVLAACATAAGTTRHYEGLFGLARAFRLAGVRTVISSLWPVEDAATAQWSEALYGARLDQGLDTDEALAATQRALLAARRAEGLSTHPYYWAAFVASGDWR